MDRIRTPKSEHPEKMSQNFGSAKKKWQCQGRFKSSNRRYHAHRPSNQGYATTQRGSHIATSSHDHWRRPNYRDYENDYSQNFSAESSVAEAGDGGGRTTPGVGIFIAPYYTDFGNSQNNWKSGYGSNSFQNVKVDAPAGEMSERWQSSSSTKGGFVSPHRSGPSSGSWSSNGSRSIDRRKQNANLRAVPYTFDVRDDRSRASYSSRRPTDPKLTKEGVRSEAAAPVEVERFKISRSSSKTSRSSSASKTAGKGTSDQDPEGGNHSVVRNEVENERRSNSKAKSSKSASKMQNDEPFKIGLPSENSKVASDRAMIPSLMGLSKIKVVPEQKARASKIISGISSKSPRKKHRSKNVGQKAEPSSSGKSHKTLSKGVSSSRIVDLPDGNEPTAQAIARPKKKHKASVLSSQVSSSRIQGLPDGNAQTDQAIERPKQINNASVPSCSSTTQEALQSPERDCRSASAGGVRPKVDILMRKKRLSGLSKGDLMKLISSPRSRQEHMQLNRILQAHAEKQKTPMQLPAAPETEGHEDVEPSSDQSGFFKEIEVSALPIEIQREIDILCQGVTDVDNGEQCNDVSIISLSNIADESISVSPLINAASDANASLQDNARQQHPKGASVCRASASASQSQCSLSEGRSGTPSSGGLVAVDKDPGAFSSPSVSRITCQPNVSRSFSELTGGTRSHEDQPCRPLTAVASAMTTCSTGLTQRVQSPATVSADSQSIVNESQSDRGGVQSLGTLLQISLQEEEIRSRLKETDGVIASLEEQLKQLKEQLRAKLSLKLELTQEKVRLRSLRLQILRDSVSHQQEESTGAMTPVMERPSSMPYESIMEVTPSGSDQAVLPPADSGYRFDSVLRNGVINIEPVNDDFESGPCYDEAVPPQYGNDETVQLITIAPTEGGNSSDEEEGLPGNSSSRDRSAAAVPSTVLLQMPEPSVGMLQHQSDAHQVLPEPDGNAVSVHMEYVGTLNTSNLQPEVLQQIALSMQPLDAQHVAGSSVNEFSCSEEETVEENGHDARTLAPSGTDQRTPEPNAANSVTVDLETDCRRSQSATSGLDDCVISRVEQRAARKKKRGTSEQTTAGSENTVSSLGEKSPRAAARAQRLASNFQAIPVSPAMPSSSTAVHNFIERPRNVPRANRRRRSPKESFATVAVSRMLATVSIGDDTLPNFDRLSYREGGGQPTPAANKRAKNTSTLQSTNDPIAQKRKSVLLNPREPPAKRRKSLENPKRVDITKRMTMTSTFPRAYPGVLYRHTESARSIVLGDEVVITASDDGQIVRHPLPRQVYGLAEKQTFTGHQGGVVGMITAKVQVTRDISRTVALSIGRDQVLKMHCIQTGKVLMTHKFDKGFCYDCISEADDTVFIGLDDGSIARITTSSFVVKEPFVFPGSSRISALSSFRDNVRSMLLVGFGDCTISVRDASNNFVIQTLRGHLRAPRFILRLNDRVVSSSGDCSVFSHCLNASLSSLNFNTIPNTFHLPAPVVAMTIQAAHELLVVACRNRTVTFIDMKENLRYIIRLTTIEFPLTCVAASHHMVYFGCNNGLVYHIDIDMKRHWSCGFFGCKDWFLLKGDLEDHVREDHVGSNLPIMINGQSRNICSWRGCNQALIKQTQTQVLAHFLSHITDLEPEITRRRFAVTN